MPISYEFGSSGGKGALHWRVTSGRMPPGIVFDDGRLSGQATEPGVYSITVELSDEESAVSREILLVARGANLAHEAQGILARVKRTNTEWRDPLWLSVPRSILADDLKGIIRDGQRLGEGSTFYSIEGSSNPKADYYGYAWGEEREIGLIAFSTGTMEENGGWFEDLAVEYRDDENQWRRIEEVIIEPTLPARLSPDVSAYNKPHFVEYLLAFQPVRTRAIRIIGKAGHAEHWYSPETHFTSIAELSVYGALPGYRELKSE